MSNGDVAGLEKARKRLKAINQGLDALDEAFKADPFDPERARMLTAELLNEKYALVDEVAVDLYGVAFDDWYTHLARIDEVVGKARHETFVEPFDFQKEKDKILAWIEAALANKEILERGLPAPAAGDPPALERIRELLKKMNEELKAILRGYPIGQFREDDIRAMIDRVTRAKFAIVELLLPTVFDIPFSRWYQTLSYIDWAAARADEESHARPPDKGHVARFIEIAKDQKESLEKELPH